MAGETLFLLVYIPSKAHQYPKNIPMNMNMNIPIICRFYSVYTPIYRCGEIYTGWWLTYPSEKYESVGMIIPNIWKVIKIMFQTTNQLYCTHWWNPKNAVLRSHAGVAVPAPGQCHRWRRWSPHAHRCRPHPAAATGEVVEKASKMGDIWEAWGNDG